MDEFLIIDIRCLATTACLLGAQLDRRREPRADEVRLQDEIGRVCVLPISGDLLEIAEDPTEGSRLAPERRPAPRAGGDRA